MLFWCILRGTLLGPSSRKCATYCIQKRQYSSPKTICPKIQKILEGKVLGQLTTGNHKGIVEDKDYKVSNI